MAKVLFARQIGLDLDTGLPIVRYYVGKDAIKFLNSNKIAIHAETDPNYIQINFFAEISTDAYAEYIFKFG